MNLKLLFQKIYHKYFELYYFIHITVVQTAGQNQNLRHGMLNNGVWRDARTSCIAAPLNSTLSCDKQKLFEYKTLYFTIMT